MKLLHVTGGDYAALEFEENFKNIEVKDFIEEYFQDTELIELELTNGREVTIDLLEFGDVDERFIEFMVDRFLDYDQSQHENFYIETQKI